MATLQSFQAEIEDIRNRELVKTRAQSQPDALRRHAEHKSAPKVRKKTVGGEAPGTSPVTLKPVIDESTQDLTDIEHSIESALLSPGGGDTLARDLIATLLTRQGGEYLLRLGARPPRAPLLADENLDNVNDWAGERRTEVEIGAMIAHLGRLVEEVGGKVLSVLNGTAFLS